MTTPSRFSLLELDGAVPDHTPAPLTGAAAVTQTDARARILAQQAELASKGYSRPRGAGEGGVTAWKGLAIGTRVNAIGDENFQLSRQSVEAMPNVEDALGKLAVTVEAEGRVNVPNVKLGSVLVRAEDGALAMKNGEWMKLAPSRTALKHLADFLAPGTGLTSYLPNAPVPVRKAAIDAHRAQVLADPKTAGKLVSVGLKRNVVAEGYGADATTCYRIAGTTYAPYEVDRGCRDLLANPAVVSALRDARAEVIYDGERARIRALWHADHVANLAAGDVFKVGMELSLDDVRGGAVRVRGLAFRNMCLNLIIIGTQKRTAMRQRHVGSTEGIAGKVAAGIQQVRADFAAFIESWGAARKDRILDAFDGDPRKVFAGLVGAGLVDLPGRREEQVETLLVAYGKEPGGTRADILNAITRAAHEGAWWSTVGDEAIAEEQAGKLLYVKNLVPRIEAGLETWNKGGIELT